MDKPGPDILCIIAFTPRSSRPQENRLIVARRWYWLGGLGDDSLPIVMYLSLSYQHLFSCEFIYHSAMTCLAS